MFPFGFSYEELFMLTVMLTVAGGYKKQFIQYSRAGGVFVGRAVGFIRQKRDQVFSSSAQRKELDALQQQVAEAVSQMQTIRYDIRNSTRLPTGYTPHHHHGNGHPPQPPSPPFNPADPLAAASSAANSSHSAAVSHSPMHLAGPSSSFSPQHAPNATSPPAGPPPALPTAPSRTSQSLSDAVNERSTPDLPASMHAPATGNAWSGTSSAPQPPGQPQSTHLQVAKEDREKFESIDIGDGSGQLVRIDGVPLIPVTASQVRKGPAGARRHAPTAADVLEDALMEQLVARKAASFMHGSSSSNGGGSGGGHGQGGS